MSKSRFTNEIRQFAIAQGIAYGEAEVEMWIDQHESGMLVAPTWTFFTWQGGCPAEIADDDNLVELFETILETEAARVWNTARDEARGE